LLIGVLHKNSSFIARSLIFLCNLLSFAFHLAVRLPTSPFF
jgi:hypothetical protein